MISQLPNLFEQIITITKRKKFLLAQRILYINNMLKIFKEANWFSSLNLKSSYQHTDESKKLAFVTRNGLFKFKVMPFS